MSEAACECLQRSFRPLVRSDAGTSSSGTGLWPFAMQSLPRRPGIENHPATESARGTPHRRPQTGTTRQIPVAYVGNPRRPQDVFVLRPASLHTTSCAYEREVDSPLVEIWSTADTAVAPDDGLDYCAMNSPGFSARGAAVSDQRFASVPAATGPQRVMLKLGASGASQAARSLPTPFFFASIPFCLVGMFAHLRKAG
jgi:hypothetical protein